MQQRREAKPEKKRRSEKYRAPSKKLAESE